MVRTRHRLYAVAMLLGLLAVLSLVMVSPHVRSTSTTVLITAVYYDTYLTNEPDEAFRLTNVSDSSVDLNGWGITDEEGTVARDATGTPTPVNPSGSPAKLPPSPKSSASPQTSNSEA